MQTMGQLMYKFLERLYLTESERLFRRNQKRKENPLASFIDEGPKAKKQQAAKQKKRLAADSSDEQEESQAPIVVDYSENFPALPDEDGRGRKIRQANERQARLQQSANGWVMNPEQRFNFRTNHVNEVQPLNEIKNRYKQITNEVIQDLYNVFNDVALVGQILQMTFPALQDYSASL